ncbi:MAG: sugar phosphate isomerase/epimerase [Eubacterium sp.]|nr:sugar phosphate isomerase/epimerase [Eubacterium sp.]
MKQFDANKYKLAVPEWCLPGDSIFSIRLASELGLDGLQIEAGFPNTGFKLSHKRVRELYVETAQQYGIELISIVMNDLNNHGLRHGRGTEAGDIAYEHLDISLEAVADMGIKVLMIPHFEDNDIHTDEDRMHVVEALQYACDRAKEHDVTIAAETAILSESFISLAEEINRDNLTLFYDSQNYMCFRGYNPMDHLPAVYPYMINQLHVKDGIGEAWSSKLLGEGDSHFYEQIAWLKEHDYSGWFVFENYYTQLPLRKEAKDPIDLLKKDIETLKTELMK